MQPAHHLDAYERGGKTKPVTPVRSAAHTGIVVEEITKRFGRRTALDNLSLDVAPGSVLALLGHNGAGKTTLVRILTTLIRPDHGRAWVGGHNVLTEAAFVRRAIGLVGQHAAVDDYLTGRENLTLVARLLRIGRAETSERVDASLDAFGLTDVADTPAATYSGGLRRRLDIAVTMLAHPAVLFLDEPTTGLDPASRRDVWALIDKLVKGGTTVLLTTQYLDEADRLADTVAVIARGSLLAGGTPDDLKRRLGGDTVQIRFADADALTGAVSLLGRTWTITQVDRDNTTIELRAQDGSAVLPEALRHLDGRRFTVTAAEVRRPGLDDVYLALTGSRRRQHSEEREDTATSTRRAHHHSHTTRSPR